MSWRGRGSGTVRAMAAADCHTAGLRHRHGVTISVTVGVTIPVRFRATHVHGCHLGTSARSKATLGAATARVAGLQHPTSAGWQRRAPRCVAGWRGGDDGRPCTCSCPCPCPCPCPCTGSTSTTCKGRVVGVRRDNDGAVQARVLEGIDRDGEDVPASCACLLCRPGICRGCKLLCPKRGRCHAANGGAAWRANGYAAEGLARLLGGLIACSLH